MNGLCAVLLIFSTARCAGAQPRVERDIPLPQQSAGVFIGIEKFSHDFSLERVYFAVNDAIDLAYSLSIERGLLPPNRVLLLLAGEPDEGSRERLAILLAAGAKQQTARQADIYTFVQEQSRVVGQGGILVVSIATHGYSYGAETLLLAEDSILQFDTGVTAERLLQATDAGPGGLRLLIVDACRTPAGTQPFYRSAMPPAFFETLATRPGYVVFSATSIGGSAITGARNGLFTGAIIDALGCKDTEPKTSIRFADIVPSVKAEVARESRGSQHPELREGDGFVDFALPSCAGQIKPPPDTGRVTPEILRSIEEAKRYAEAGGLDNLEKSFRLYRQAFKDIPLDVLASLNQGYVAHARKLEDNSQRAEGIRIYSQLLDPLLAQLRSNSN